MTDEDVLCITRCAALGVTAPAAACSLEIIDLSPELVIVTDIGGGDFTFVQSGFTDGASVTGSFTATDLDGNGQIRLCPVNRHSPFLEVTAFAASFSGNALIPAFALDFTDLFALVYDLDGDIGDGLTGQIESVTASYPPARPNRGFWIVHPGPIERTCDGVNVCGIVGIVVIPEPGTLALFSVGLLGLGLVRRGR